MGSHKQITLIEYQRLGSILGNPSTVAGTYSVVNGQPGASLQGGSTQPSLLLMLTLALGALAVIPITILATTRSNREEKTSEAHFEEQQSPEPPSVPPPRVTYLRINPRSTTRSCPTCHHLATYVQQQSKWYCSRCQKRLD